MRFTTVVALLLLMSTTALLAQVTPAVPANDLDSDGLDDTLEQQLLEKFRPVFMLSGSECDVAPAEFMPGTIDPTVKNRNGAIYGQVFPRGDNDSALIEIHYYHLWSRDCARFGHALDAEYVAALVRAEQESRKALYWYAAAHEDTMCDGSSGATAASLQADTRGAVVWVSSGKHASFLSKECTGACGEDRCENPSAMVAGALLNVGEVGKPLNGASWTSSPLWRLSMKMQPVFSDAVVAQLSASGRIIPVNDSSRAKKGVIRRAGMTADALESGHDRTGDAMATGSKKTGDAVSTGYSSTKSSLRRAAGAVGRWFRGNKSKAAN
jgi:hypothetical protein